MQVKCFRIKLRIKTNTFDTVRQDKCTNKVVIHNLTEIQLEPKNRAKKRSITHFKLKFKTVSNKKKENSINFST